VAAVLHRFPMQLADLIGRVVQRLTIGDLRESGLKWPEEGIFLFNTTKGNRRSSWAMMSSPRSLSDSNRPYRSM